MKCKVCGSEYVVNRFHKLCKKHNNERLHGSKHGKTYQPSKNNIELKYERLSAKISKDDDVYKQVFNQSNHLCEECGKQLNIEFRDDDGRVACRWRYSHILPKSTYPEFRHNILNFNNLCLKCHQEWENGCKENMRIYKKNLLTIEEMKKEQKKYCEKCGSKLKKINTGIYEPNEPYHPEDPYDGSYRAIFFSFCEKCNKKQFKKG